MEDFNQQAPSVPVKPENNQVLAIIATVSGVFSCSLCCIGFILGVIALVLSGQVGKKYDLGDYAGAESAAKNTKLISYIALGVTAVSIVYMIYSLLTGGIDQIMDAYNQALEQQQSR